MSKNNKKRALTEVEKKLWRDVTKDIARYQTALSEIGGEQQSNNALANTPGSGGGFGAGNALRASSGKELNQKAVKQTLRPARKNVVATKTTVRSQKPQSVFAAGDPAQEKRVRRGRLPIDAVLDLHGLSQVDAEERLRRFITLAHHQKARCVLVITGKGVKPTKKHDEPFDMHSAPRGILRTRFLDWVDQAPLRNLITRVSNAKPTDGGQGAFYVFIKRD